MLSLCLLMHFVYRFISKELVCLPPAAGLLASNPGFTAVLPAPSDPAGNMGEGPSQFLSLGVDCPVNGPVCCLRVAKASISPKTIFFSARDGMISNRLQSSRFLCNATCIQGPIKYLVSYRWYLNWTISHTRHYGHCWVCWSRGVQGHCLKGWWEKTLEWRLSNGLTGEHW